jgi:hypothetical protein
MVERKRIIPVEEVEQNKLEVKEIVKKGAPVVPVDTRSKLRKLGGGSIILDRKMIKPNQVFYYNLSDIPTAFRDMFEVIKEGSRDTVIASAQTKVNKVKFEKKVNADNTYSVVNKVTGKTINSETLSENEADTIVKNLNG